MNCRHCGLPVKGGDQYKGAEVSHWRCMIKATERIREFVQRHMERKAK